MSAIAGYTGIREEAHRKYRSKRLQEGFLFLKTITFGGDNDEQEDEDVFWDDSFLDESSSPRPCSSVMENDSSCSVLKDPHKKQQNSTSSQCVLVEDDGKQQKVHFDNEENEFEASKSTYINLKELAKDFVHVSSSECVKQGNKQLSGKRVILVTPHHVPFQLFSIVPYRKSQVNSSTESTRRSSFSNIPHHITSVRNIFIENIDFGDGKNEVSYKHLLNPEIYTRKRMCTVGSEMDLLDESTESSLHEVEEVLLDDPELTSGKHRTVLNLASFMVSIIQYAKPAKVKKDINERFKEEFPSVTITLSKLRSLKAEILAIGQKMLLDCAIIACAFLYFEKTVLKTKITKHNRKCIAGACLLLSIKFCDDIHSKNIKACMEAITDQFRVSAKELVCCELQVLILMEFSMMTHINEVLPIYKRLEANLRNVRQGENFPYQLPPGNSQINCPRREVNSLISTDSQ